MLTERHIAVRLVVRRPRRTRSFRAANGRSTSRVIYQQKKMGRTVEDWQLIGETQFPKIAPIAVRLAVVAVQSADVERACKAHKIIHTKARNRLYTTTVSLLLSTYINLRLLNKCTKDMGDFLTQTLSACDDTEELPAGEDHANNEQNDPQEVEEDVEDMTIGGDSESTAVGADGGPYAGNTAAV